MSVTSLILAEKRLLAFRLTLQGASDHRKKGNVSLAIANEFNRVLDETRALLPEVADGLPTSAPTRGFGASMDLAPISYLDLEMLVDQTLAMIELTREMDDSSS